MAEKKLVRNGGIESKRSEANEVIIQRKKNRGIGDP